jgi:hypothetical protein
MDPEKRNGNVMFNLSLSNNAKNLGFFVKEVLIYPKRNFGWRGERMWLLLVDVGR